MSHMDFVISFTTEQQIENRVAGWLYIGIGIRKKNAATQDQQLSPGMTLVLCFAQENTQPMSLYKKKQKTHAHHLLVPGLVVQNNTLQQQCSSRTLHHTHTHTRTHTFRLARYHSDLLYLVS